MKIEVITGASCIGIIMKNFVIFIALSILWTPFVGAQSILLSEVVPLNAVPNLNQQDIKSDLNVFTANLQKSYGGRGILPKGQYEELIQGLSKIGNHLEESSSEKLCNEIAKLTEQLNDYHLTVHIEDKTCERVWPVASVGSNSGYGQSNSTWSLSTKQLKGQNVSVLAIQKMSPSLSPDWNGFLETVSYLKDQGKPFIIDLRRNPGGDFSRGAQMAAILYGVDTVDKVPMPKKTIYRQRSPESWAALANVSWLQIQFFKENQKAIPNYLNDLYQSLVGFYNKALQGLISPIEIQQLGNEQIDLANAIQFPVYVLVDRNCGSSCELTLEAFEKLPSIQTVGENTTGVVQYGNVGALYLPKSHIVIRLPTQGAIYADQRQVEKTGYSPRWKIAPGTDALDYTLNRFF